MKDYRHEFPGNKEGIEFIDETKTTSFDIEDADDDLT